jgi:hypothetical protein
MVVVNGNETMGVVELNFNGTTIMVVLWPKSKPLLFHNEAVKKAILYMVTNDRFTAIILLLKKVKPLGKKVKLVNELEVRLIEEYR